MGLEPQGRRQGLGEMPREEKSEATPTLSLSCLPSRDTGQRRCSQGPQEGGRELEKVWAPFPTASPPATFGDVEVEEVTVEDRLDQACHDGDEVKEALEVVAPDPVEEIERAVDAQRKQVVARDGLRLARLAHHEQLRQDGH